MKPFNLEEYLENPSKKIVTRNGLNVRIVCTDAKSDCPVIGLVDYNDRESAYTFTKDGKWIINFTNNCGWISNSNDKKDLDLFFYTEKHEGWINLYKHKEKANAKVGNSIFKSQEDAERNKSSDSIATIKIEWEE